MTHAETIALSERRAPARPVVVGSRRAAAEIGAPARLLPAISQPLLRWFTWYSARYMRRHFHALRVSVASMPPRDLPMPMVFYSNHASWWDPLVALILRRHFFPQRNLYAPMEARALENYGLFKRLGVFGVEQDSSRGAINFIRRARAILNQSDNALWLTPQSRFADARDLPARLKGGIGHLPRLATEICFVPVAIEYPFWEERLPEILVRFGQPRIPQHGGPLDAAAWTAIFSQHLTETQRALAAESVQREPRAFHNLLAGRTGVGGGYDRWRAMLARLRGQKFRSAHSNL